MAARPRQALRVVLITTAAIAATLLATLLLAPMLVDLPAVRAELQRKLSQGVNGQIAWESLQVRFLPLPRGVLRGVRVEIPGRARLAMERADAELRLIPLARGRVEISSIRVARPVIELDVVASPTKPSRADAGFLVAYRDAIGAVTESMRRFAPDSVVSIEAASLVVRAPDVPPIELDDLSMQAQTGDRGLDFDITSAGTLWRKLHLVGRVEFADLSSHVSLEAIEIRPQPWIDRLVAERALGVGVQTADLRAQARTDGRTSFQCDVDLAAPSIRVSRNQRSMEVSGIKVKGKVDAREQGTRIDVTDFQLGQLVPGATAVLDIAGDAQHPEISIDVARLDVAVLRDAALSLAGDIAAVAEYAPRVHAGDISRAHMTAAARTWADVFDLRSIKAGLSLERGVLLLPVVERDAANLSARAELADGVIHLDALSARLGDSSLTGGSASYALLDRSLRADSEFEIRLAQGLDLVRKTLLPNERDRLDDIASASGRLRGRVRAAKPAHADWNATVDIAQSDAAVQLKQLPWPAVLSAARVSASPGRISVSGLHAALGRSTLENAAVQIALDPEPSLMGATAQATLVLDELYPSLRTQPQLADAVREFASVAGSAHVTLTRLTGALSRPRELQYDVTVQPRQVSVTHDRLPDRVDLAGGSVRIDPTNLTVDSVGVAVLDARATISGSVANYPGDRPQVDANAADGAVGPKAMQWAWERAGPPQRLRPATPLRFSVARARWDGDRNLDVQGTVGFSGGQDLTADLAWNPQAIDVRRVSLKDQLSNATIGFRTSNRLLHAHFSGSLDGRSVAAMFEQGREQSGILDGDLQVTLDLDAPTRTTARGRLTGRSIDLSHLVTRPVLIDRIVLEADEETLHVREAAVSVAQQTATLNGVVRRGEHGPIVNGRIELSGIDLDALLPKESASSENQGPASSMPASAPAAEGEGILPHLWPLPVTGQIDVRTPFVRYQDYRVAPVAATVTLETRRAQMVLHEAQLCAIAFPLTAAVAPQNFTISLQLLAHEQQLSDVVRCLTRQEVQMTGRFDLRADLSTHGSRGELIRNLSGTLDAQAHDGSTYKFKLIGNILSFKPVTDLLERGKPQLESEGLPYRRLNVAGRFQSGKFHIDEGAFDSDAVGLATTGAIDLATREAGLTVLVAPFNRVNRMVRNVPIAGYILGGELVAIAVGVHGDIRDPTVTPLGPQAVTNQLAGILERTLTLPAKLLAPLDSGERAKQPAAQP